MAQLNDTHPSIAISELMRILVDEEGLEWDKAWVCTQRTFGYTNHTILPEALEKWSVELMAHLLPRNLEVIYLINWNFLESLRSKGVSDDFLRKVSIVEVSCTQKTNQLRPRASNQLARTLAFYNLFSTLTPPTPCLSLSLSHTHDTLNARMHHMANSFEWPI